MQSLKVSLADVDASSSRDPPPQTAPTVSTCDDATVTTTTRLVTPRPVEMLKCLLKFDDGSAFLFRFTHIRAISEHFDGLYQVCRI